MLVLVIAVVLVAVIAGIFKLQSVPQVVGSDKQDNFLVVEVLPASVGDISEMTNLNAVVEAKDSVNIIPKLGGLVEGVNVSVGSQVKAGQLIIQLEQKDFLAQLKQAEAGLAAAQAGKKSAVASYQDALKNLERMEKLYEEGAVAEQQLEQVRLQCELSDPAGIDAQIEQAQAAVDAIRLQLQNTAITSPISGVITAVEVSVGDMAGPSMPVAVVMDLDEMQVTLGVAEQYINNIKVGDEVEVRIAAIDPEPISGVIKAISAAIDPRTKAFPVEITLDNPGHIIKAGMSVEVQLVTKTVKDALVVPMEAVVDQGSRRVVFVVENEIAIARHVGLGLNDGKMTQVLEGLAEGEKVIVKGQNLVGEGETVIVRGGEN